MAALGRSGARFHPEKVDIAYGEHLVARNGLLLGPEAAAARLIKAVPFTVSPHLHAGDCAEDYIRINADFRN